MLKTLTYTQSYWLLQQGISVSSHSLTKKKVKTVQFWTNLLHCEVLVQFSGIYFYCSNRSTTKKIKGLDLLWLFPYPQVFYQDFVRSYQIYTKYSGKI